LDMHEVTTNSATRDSLFQLGVLTEEASSSCGWWNMAWQTTWKLVV